MAGAGCGLSFPCDAAGKVDAGALTESGRRSYLGARVLVGISFAAPVVEAAAR